MAIKNESILKEPADWGLSERTRVVMHLDMDAFFGSVEQAANPMLRGRPIAVCGSKERSVVSCASYEARPYGVKAGMPVNQARRICPSLTLVEADISKYVDTSMRVISILRGFSPKVEVYSIDEAFLDVTGCLLLFSGVENIVGRIKERIRKELSLTCSIGVGPNKLVAKMASEMEKPDGLTVIRKDELHGILKELPVQDLPGVGDKLAHHLEVLGIRTCGQLGTAPVSMLTRRFGIIGQRLREMGQGIDNSPVIPLGKEPEAKSVGHSMTLDRDISDRREINRFILQLSEMVGRRLRKARCSGRTVTLTLRYSDFHTFTKQMTLERYINESREIYLTALEILDSLALRQPVRLLGVKVSALSRDCLQLSFFPQDRKRREVMKVMDRVNDRYGEFSLTYSSLLDNLRQRRVITPNWRPEEDRHW